MTVKEFLTSLSPEQIKGLENLLRCVNPVAIYSTLTHRQLNRPRGETMSEAKYQLTDEQVKQIKAALASCPDGKFDELVTALTPVKDQTLSVKLKDGSPDHTGEVTVQAVAGTVLETLEIGIEGYGDHDSDAGFGMPIMLELYEGRLVLRVWADINSEAPTHRIDLEGAREALRRPYYSVGYRVCSGIDGRTVTEGALLFRAATAVEAAERTKREALESVAADMRIDPYVVIDYVTES